MDYSTILQELNKASLFDLFRLKSAIDQELINPYRNEQIKAKLKIGELISYFDPQSNALIEATILKVQKTRCLVRNIKDQKNWNIPFYFINLEDVETDIQPPKGAMGIPKNCLKVGAKVGFKGKDNNDLFGVVVRLNQKRATIKTNQNGEWLVPYGRLFSVIDSETADAKAQTYISPVL